MKEALRLAKATGHTACAVDGTAICIFARLWSTGITLVFLTCFLQLTTWVSLHFGFLLGLKRWLLARLLQSLLFHVSFLCPGILVHLTGA